MKLHHRAASDIQVLTFCDFVLLPREITFAAGITSLNIHYHIEKQEVLVSRARVD